MTDPLKNQMTKMDPLGSAPEGYLMIRADQFDDLCYALMWDTENAVRMALEHTRNGTRTPEGGTHESCSRFILTQWFAGTPIQRLQEMAAAVRQYNQGGPTPLPTQLQPPKLPNQMAPYRAKTNYQDGSGAEVSVLAGQWNQTGDLEGIVDTDLRRHRHGGRMSIDLCPLCRHSKIEHAFLVSPPVDDQPQLFSARMAEGRVCPGTWIVQFADGRSSTMSSGAFHCMFEPVPTPPPTQAGG